MTIRLSRIALFSSKMLGASLVLAGLVVVASAPVAAQSPGDSVVEIGADTFPMNEFVLESHPQDHHHAANGSFATAFGGSVISDPGAPLGFGLLTFTTVPGPSPMPSPSPGPTVNIPITGDQQLAATYTVPESHPSLQLIDVFGAQATDSDFVVVKEDRGLTFIAAFAVALGGDPVDTFDRLVSLHDKLGIIDDDAAGSGDSGDSAAVRDSGDSGDDSDSERAFDEYVDALPEPPSDDDFDSEIEPEFDDFIDSLPDIDDPVGVATSPVGSSPVNDLSTPEAGIGAQDPGTSGLMASPTTIAAFSSGQFQLEQADLTIQAARDAEDYAATQRDQARQWRELADSARQNAEDANDPEDRAGWEEDAARRDQNADNLEEQADRDEQRAQQYRDDAEARRDAVREAEAEAARIQQDQSDAARQQAEDRATQVRDARDARQAGERADRDPTRVARDRAQEDATDRLNQDRHNAGVTGTQGPPLDLSTGEGGIDIAELEAKKARGLGKKIATDTAGKILAASPDAYAGQVVPIIKGINKVRKIQKFGEKAQEVVDTAIETDIPEEIQMIEDITEGPKYTPGMTRQERIAEKKRVEAAFRRETRGEGLRQENFFRRAVDLILSGF